jgi:hypothetical protein
VLVTKVTITDKDCAEISALRQHFPGAEHILCQFHVLKAVDSYLKKTSNGQRLNKISRLDIIKRFRLTMYTEKQAVFEEEKSALINQGN